jgi:hypothetical protein
MYRNNSRFTKIIDLNSGNRLNFKIHSKNALRQINHIIATIYKPPLFRYLDEGNYCERFMGFTLL